MVVWTILVRSEYVHCPWTFKANINIFSLPFSPFVMWFLFSKEGLFKGSESNSDTWARTPIGVSRYLIYEPTWKSRTGFRSSQVSMLALKLEIKLKLFRAQIFLFNFLKKGKKYASKWMKTFPELHSIETGKKWPRRSGVIRPGLFFMYHNLKFLLNC